jgi:hypothetical protein
MSRQLFEEARKVLQAEAAVKLDPVGQEDKDIDNDGDSDRTDSYLKKRRGAISAAIAKSKNESKELSQEDAQRISDILKGVAEETEQVDEMKGQATVPPKGPKPGEVPAYMRKGNARQKFPIDLKDLKKNEEVEQIDEVGDTPAGKAALRAVQDRAYGKMDAWSKNPKSGYSSTPKEVKKATSTAVRAGNRLQGFGPDKLNANTVMARDALRKKLASQGIGEEAEGVDNDPVSEIIEARDAFTIELPETLTYQHYLKAAMQAEGIESLRELDDEMLMPFLAVVEELFMEGEEEFVILELSYSEMQDKIYMHQRQGNKVTGVERKTMNGQPYAAYVVTDKNGMRRKYIYQGNVRRVQNLGQTTKPNETNPLED